MTWFDLHLGPLAFLVGFGLCVLATLLQPRRIADVIPAVATTALAGLALNAWRPHVGDAAYVVLATLHLASLAFARVTPPATARR